MIADGLSLIVGLLALFVALDVRRRLDRLERLVLNGQTAEEHRRLRAEAKQEQAERDSAGPLPGLSRDDAAWSGSGA